MGLLKDLTFAMARAVVSDPDQVRVKAIKAETVILLELSVAPDDMGRVIGKKGAMANAMRTLLRVSAAKEGKRVNLEIV